MQELHEKERRQAGATFHSLVTKWPLKGTVYEPSPGHHLWMAQASSATAVGTLQHDGCILAPSGAASAAVEALFKLKGMPESGLVGRGSVQIAIRLVRRTGVCHDSRNVLGKGVVLQCQLQTASKEHGPEGLLLQKLCCGADHPEVSLRQARLHYSRRQAQV